jgi:hypothetical protein
MLIEMEATDFVNLKILSHPVNWLVVWTVLLFGAFAWHLLHNRFTAAPPITTA